MRCGAGSKHYFPLLLFPLLRRIQLLNVGIETPYFTAIVARVNAAAEIFASAAAFVSGSNARSAL